MCLFFRQNGGDGFLQEKERLIPQQFNIFLWISGRPLRNDSDQRKISLKAEEKKTDRGR
jgi:hypothetical protein